MLTDSSIAFLKQLLDTPGPSGFETAPAKVWRTEAATFASVRSDVIGNSLAEVAGSGGPTILLPASHRVATVFFLGWLIAIAVQLKTTEGSPT